MTAFYVKAVLYFTSVINSNAIFNEVKNKGHRIDGLFYSKF